LCQFCDHDSFSSKEAFLRHTKSVHAPIVASSSVEAILLQSEEQVDKIAGTACHLCDGWEEELRRRNASRGSSAVPAHELSGPLKQFRRHMARHMEQLALFAISQNKGERLEDDSVKGDDETSDSSDTAEVEAISPDAVSLASDSGDFEKSSLVANQSSFNASEGVRSRSLSNSSSIDRSEYPKRGRTRIPARLVSKEAITELGYEFEEDVSSSPFAENIY
jgi:hypothetical protein